MITDRKGTPINVGDEVDHLGRQQGRVIDIDESNLPLVLVQVEDEKRMIPYMDLTVMGINIER